MNGIRFSQLIETDILKDNDFIPIIQNGENRKIKGNVLKYLYADKDFVISELLNKADKIHYHKKDEILGFPSNLSDFFNDLDMSGYIKKTDPVFENIKNSIIDIENELEDLINPFSITLSSNKTIAELGSIVSNISFTWAYNRNITSQKFENAVINVSLRALTYTQNVNTNKTFTLETTINSKVYSKTLNLNFYNGIYYGSSNASTYNSALIKSLTKVLSDNKGRTISVSCGNGEYIYYCLPERLGNCKFTVGGFSGGFAKVTTLSFVNDSGYTENYSIYKSDNPSLGNISITIS